jgi:hypothetical protein
MPVTSNRDKVRLMVGDTNEDDPLLYDDEVDAFLTQRTVLNDSGGTVSVNLAAAAADCAGAIAGKYSRDFDFSEDSQQFSRAQRVGHYLSLERDLRNRSGGISVPIGGTIAS